MPDINEVVSVNVTVQDASPTTANFGIMAIFAGDGPDLAGSWQGTYAATPTGLAAMVTDGFSVTGAAYLKAAAIVAQSPRIDRFKVYKRATPNSQSVTMLVTKTTEGFVQYVEIGTGGSFTAISRANGASETATQIATALELLIEAVTGVASSSSTDTVTATPADAGGRLYVKNATRHLTINDASTNAGIETDLAEAAVEDADFFGFVIDSPSKAEIIAAAAWAESNQRMFHGLSFDSNVFNNVALNVGAAVKAAGYHFSSVVASRDPKAAADASLMARQLSRDPGSSTWHLKELPGVTVDSLTDTEFANCKTNNVIPYVSIKGLSRTFDGKAGSGRFLDITHGVSWMKARIGERIFALLASLEKLAFTDAGIALLESAVRAILTQAETMGIMAAGWTVTVPKAADVSSTDRGNRLLPDLKFNGRLAGAIHKAEVDGTVSV